MTMLLYLLTVIVSWLSMCGTILFVTEGHAITLPRLITVSCLALIPLVNLAFMAAAALISGIHAFETDDGDVVFRWKDKK